MQDDARDDAHRSRPTRACRRRGEAPQVIALEPDDPILLPDAAADDDDRRDAQRPTRVYEIVLVADEID